MPSRRRQRRKQLARHPRIFRARRAARPHRHAQAQDNVDTYAYFGEPVYIYSLKEGINDGFLTPFKVKQISTTLDEYVYTPDDKLIEGESRPASATRNRFQQDHRDQGTRSAPREAVHGADQPERKDAGLLRHAGPRAGRARPHQPDEDEQDPNYCQRVTANDGALGDQHLRDFQDNEKTIPTILTTSQKLSTGVDARNIRNIVLMRPINSMIEFKQIIGRGTRLYDGKDYFTIYDFVKAHQHFSDPEWDGEPIEPEPKEPKPAARRAARRSATR
jgi:type I restriction enzyme R subunit